MLTHEDWGGAGGKRRGGHEFLPESAATRAGQMTRRNAKRPNHRRAVLGTASWLSVRSGATTSTPSITACRQPHPLSLRPSRFTAPDTTLPQAPLPSLKPYLTHTPHPLATSHFNRTRHAPATTLPFSHRSPFLNASGRARDPISFLKCRCKAEFQ